VDDLRTNRGDGFIKTIVCWLGALTLFVSTGFTVRAIPLLHAQVLVFVPAYEASQLIDLNLRKKQNVPACVWGNFSVFLSSKLYFDLRMPNSLVSRPMLTVGPIDIYLKFIETMTEAKSGAPGFSPYTQGSDFFIFAYDWRQEIASVSAPLLGKALEDYARVHERLTGIPASQTKFTIVTHSMGGLVARTLLSEKAEWASRISRLYLVGSPNMGCVEAIKTVVVGPDSLKVYASGFPGIFLNLLPTNVDQNVTKLVGITRPSLYELLPFDDPHWQSQQANGSSQRLEAEDVLSADSWEPYWPSAQLEKKLFLNGWLHARKEEGRKPIEQTEWEYCQDQGYAKLKTLLSQAVTWRHVMGRLSRTNSLLTRSGEASRLTVILSAGLPTPTGVVTEGSHDASRADYIYESVNAGDGTVEEVRVLDDLEATSPTIERLHGVPHGRLMIDPQALSYFTRELSDQPMVPKRGIPVLKSAREP
jgi:pimeloyl-ACP methyl ester carboxylesterase